MRAVVEDKLERGSRRRKNVLTPRTLPDLHPPPTVEFVIKGLRKIYVGASEVSS